MLKFITGSILALIVGSPASASVVIDYNHLTRYAINDGSPELFIIGPKGKYVSQCDHTVAYPVKNKGVDGYTYGRYNMQPGRALQIYHSFITGRAGWDGCSVGFSLTL